MDIDPHLKIHITIQKGSSMPPLQLCSDCCKPPKFHCPFCLPSLFKPSKHSKAVHHLNKHQEKAITAGEYKIYRCALECRRYTHYHCLYCASTLIRRIDFINHLPLCRQNLPRRLKKISLLQEAATQRDQTKRLITPSSSPGVGDIPSFEIESDDDSNNEDVTIIMDSDDQGASAWRSKFVTEPNSSKCDQTAQTNIEKPQDCDEFYFMGLVKLFKKLTPQKKAEVRMKIERLLFEAEFE